MNNKTKTIFLIIFIIIYIFAFALPLKAQTKYTESDISLIAKVTMAEAEGESILGKRLVIDTILNRVDSPYCPNTVSGVIFQPNQFTCVNNGRLNRCYVKNDIYNLVKQEMNKRTNKNVFFFRTGCYSSYGIPLFKEGYHYFSKYR